MLNALLELHIIAKKVLKSNIIQRFVILIIFLLFLFLLIRNPFSGQNIISNFEPLPDAIQYVNPARSLLLGQGFKIIYEGRSIDPAVPPLYSLTLVPFYLFSSDVRSYYFTNVILAIFSAGLFYLILCRLKLPSFLIILSFFAFCTNAVVFWYPQVAMSENLFLLLYLLSVWMFLSVVSVKNIIIAGLVCVSFYATKYIAVMLSFIFGLIYLYKVFYYAKSKKRTYFYVSIFIISVLVPYLMYDAYEYLNKGFHIWPILYLPILFESGVKTTLNSVFTPPSPVYYSINNVSSNFSQYLAGLMGGELSVAKQDFIIMSPIIGMIGLIGLLLNPFLSKFKLLSGYLLTSFLSIFIIACYFYITEGRYLFFAVPVLILSFTLLIDRLWHFF